MNDFILRFTFNFQDRDSIRIARKEFGGLLKRLNLKYRSEKNFRPYQYSSRSSRSPWAFDFLILPPEYQQDKYLEVLRLLKESYLTPFQDTHPALGSVTIYRNLNSFPSLTHTTSDWWK